MKLDVDTWVGKLQERLALARETARQRSVEAVGKRKEAYDKGACVRSFEVGNLVWSRIPGTNCKLAEAWSGPWPWEVVTKLNAVNYRVKRVGESQVVHINTLKACVDREERVYRLTVVAEVDEELDAGKIVLSKVCAHYNEADIECIKREFSDVLKNEPGNTESSMLELELLDSTRFPTGYLIG